ncbi:MAG: hypothetical protein HYZ28_15275 [Myxococcales bacterium]|nr:hypothetical protein [Myxococcales bacterium]
MGNPDLLTESPRIWKFFDDFGASLPVPEFCGTGAEASGPVYPLWRHTLVPMWFSVTFSELENGGVSGTKIAGYAVSSADRRLAAIAGGALWLYDAQSGTPERIWVHSWTYQENFAGLTRDGRLVWLPNASSPALLDLADVDFFDGPRAAFSWESEYNDAGISYDVWEWPAPTIARDGTLVWKSGDGSVRAIGIDGKVQWQRFVPGGGFAPMDDEGTTYWAQSSTPMGIRVSDGSVKFYASPPPGGLGADAIHVPAAGALDLWIMNWWYGLGTNSPGDLLAAHSVADGSVVWFKDRKSVWSDQVKNLAGGGLQAIQGFDGNVYVTSRFWKASTGSKDDTVGWLAALEGGTGARKWDVVFPFAEGITLSPDRREKSDVVGAPVASRTKSGVYVASANCRLYSIDSDGNIRWWYRLSGRPLPFVPVLHDGILYVLAWAPTGLKSGERVCPGTNPFKRSEGYEGYGCMSQSEWACRPCIEGGKGTGVYHLYAFKVE